MICPSCNQEVPVGSKLCPYCEYRLTDEATSQRMGGILRGPLNPEDAPAPESTPVSEPIPAPEPGPVPAPGPGREKRRAPVLLIVLCAVLATACVALLAWGFRLRTEKEAADASKRQLQTELADAEDEVEEQQERISSLRQQADSYSIKAGDYDRLVEQLRYGVGYGSPDFYALDSVVTVSQSEADRSFRVYANKTATITLSYSGAVSCSWTGDDWVDDVNTVRISPLYRGVGTVHFTNSVDDESFDVVILVTD